ncbi:hypothetical protein H7I87_00605 [Mycobacterium timonense]|uniref:Uncharacterized protein n=1 Tax=Mycobacterium bouchedurhonense TaxID=701041 RepID=A0AAW5S1Y7_MYCBC|nr:MULTISPECIES: hypothetical protein [Mycobacterium avium complex (MAC)]MCV6988716.1 hypothetical protein [Mycobacterium bouchedurhonense]MCV6993264.1 hypothetical protein [Mycobacterium timonense]MDV3306625.1 hypothetical protein [Mycobacterium avium subsp. hominissuis]
MDKSEIEMIETALANWYKYGDSDNADTAIDLLAELAGFAITYDDVHEAVTLHRK